MEKENKSMDLNKETAMRLWNKFFGKRTTVIDFAGRKILKGAYNNRNSKYGWNVDHILPQSKGGKTADYNLIICHILTNDEKADTFPVFKANDKCFQILKVENHYEINQRNKEISGEKNKIDCDDLINFMDSAAGVRYFKSLKGIQNKSRFVGTVLIRLQNVTNTAVIDFIERFFDEENVSFENSYTETRIIAKNYTMSFKEDVNKLLDKCITLNTYLMHYFKPSGYIEKYDIFYQIEFFKNNQEMYLNVQDMDSVYSNEEYGSALFINYQVYINSEAKEKEKNMNFEDYCCFQKYNYYYINLAKNLEKEVKK